MEYENPQVPEEVNLPQEHPLKDFAWMLGAVSGLLVIAIVTLVLLTDLLIDYVPFELEKRLAASIEFLPDEMPQDLSESESINPETATSTLRARHNIEQYLQQLADALISTKPLPNGMKVDVHYADDDLVNAFATLGGHIIIHRGLIEKLDSENALAMVIAHEIEHIRHRHPLRAAGRHTVIMLALASITGFSDSSAIESFISVIGTISLIGFSRDQEAEADAAALSAMQNYYGHVGGANQLFEVLMDETGDSAYMKFLSTHPLNEDRIQSINDFMSKQQPSRQALIPLPAIIGDDAVLTNP